jgi:hypothetical protein
MKRGGHVGIEAQRGRRAEPSERRIHTPYSGASVTFLYAAWAADVSAFLATTLQ